MDRIGIRHGREGKNRVDMRATSLRHKTDGRRVGSLGVLGLGWCGLILTWSGACGSDSGSAPDRIDEPFTVQAEVYPEWREAPSLEPALPDSAATSEPKSLGIYLDLSRPMAGYLPLDASSTPREGSGGTNEFRAVAQWVPDHLTRVYPTASLQWRGVGRDIRDLSEYPRLERSLFVATASRLDLAIQEALVDLRSGRSEGVAVISDLLGTGALTGALAVSRYLSDWLDSEGVRTSEFHLGLVGVKASYWGATASACPARNGLGCWYSERGRGWRRLDDVAVAPFYVLLLGRDAESLMTILQSIESDAASIGIETVAELLTAGTRPRLAPLTCEASEPDGEQRGRQYALLRDEQSGEYACVRNDPVKLYCDFGGGFVPTDVRIGAFRGGVPDGLGIAPPSGVAQVEVDVDCEALRSQEPLPDLLLDIEGNVVGSQAPPWDEWSIETDDLPTFPGKTLQLRYFIEEVRVMPDRYRAELPPILRGGSR